MTELELRAKMRRMIWFLSLSLCILGGGWSPRSQNAPPKLPALPQILPDEFPAPIRDKVRESYTTQIAHPESAVANGELGMLLEAANKSDERAEICYQRAHLLDPSSYRWAYYLGVVQANRGKPSEAAEAFREALRLEPSYLPARSRLAESLRESGSVKEARKIFEAVVNSNPGDAQARYDLGQACRSDNDLNAAVESFRKACELFPNFGAAHYALAHLYERLGKPDLAREELNLYEKNRYDIPGVNDPLLAAVTELYINPESLVQSGIEYANQGKLEKAVAEEEKALQIDPKLFKAHVNLISFYGRLHEFEKAEDHYQLAREINPASPESYHNYGVLLVEEGKYQTAEQQFRKALEIDPWHAEALTSLGLLLERRGQQQQAMDAYRKAIAAKPEYRQAHFNLGRILVNQKNYAEGIQELLKTLAPVDETTPSYLYALGASYGRAGDKQNALKYLREAQVQASVRGQDRLLANIERDLHTVESE
jgi:Tfp pilus assembly protein PilF